MHDIKFIRDNPDAFDRAVRLRGMEPQSAKLIELDRKRRAAQAEFDELQGKRNALSREIGAAKARKDEARAQALMAEVAVLKERLGLLEVEQRAHEVALTDALSRIPNLPAEDVPEGLDETSNVELRRSGSPRSFSFKPKEHFDLGEALGYMDFAAGVKLAGARFTVLKSQLARLERALGQFMLDLHTTEFGYTEMQPPLMVNDASAFGTGQLPKFGDDLFRTTTGYWLIPTAEVPLTNLARDLIIDENELPWRFTALTPCFRSEAGAAGRDTRGMIRQHQFDKVELVSIVAPEKSVVEHERMTDAAETVLKKLGLPFRTMLLCAGDMGGAARKTYDLEVWLPGQNQYREISSCSNCGDWQARRMNARCRAPGEKQTRFVHTLNGSGLAVGRALIAVMENYQNEDGSIAVPDVLKPYMGGLTKIEKAT
ncbi:MAG TPA: serine--tRNA ligase [Ferrovibrio sp.]|jgi:seryl-tRNA synthetase|uniref:serine--tRNA ligase n=1 Tax=Ferrovibrio sp. TaxID=1917215 RepID=UPI002B4B2955|nr:serine--tRNA ligase [Ferrovibrio sp.]HLT77230.1 serine--tRNA ligase [Ferrovibrio sp.]